MHYTLDRKPFESICTDCGRKALGIRGNLFQNGEPVGYYLIRLHGPACGASARLLVIRLSREDGGKDLAASMCISCGDAGIQFQLEDVPNPGQSDELEILPADAARQSPHREEFFQLAEHVVVGLPEALDYLGVVDAARIPLQEFFDTATIKRPTSPLPRRKRRRES